MTLKLFPPAKKVKITAAELSLAGRRYIRLLKPCSDNLTDAIRRFAECTTVNLGLTFGNPDASQVLLTIDQGSGPSVAGSYELKSDSTGILLRARNESGVYYGLATLNQILEQADSSVPHFLVQDKPDFATRGVMLDVSRCKVPSMKTLYRLIDQFSQMKINQLQLYTEHTFEFVSHPLVWADASPMTAGQMVELKAYCRARFIELVPNLNSFGHFERWLRHPEYHGLAECPDGFVHPLSNQKIKFGSTLKPNRQSLALLRELYDEYLPLFDSSNFNVGGDEPWELGQGWSRKKCDKLGTANVYIDFLAKIQKLVESGGKRMMFWGDIVLKEPEMLQHLTRDLIALNWGYEGNHPFKKECEQLAAHNIPFYVCPGTSSWNSIIGRISNAQANLRNAARNGLKYGAEGYLITDWGDHGHHQYLPFSYPGFLIGACQSWNSTGSSRLDLVEGLNSTFLKSAADTSADLLVELGKVSDIAPSSLRNATIFNQLLFWDMAKEPESTQSIPNKQLKQCELVLTDIRSQVKQRVGDDRLFRGELLNATDMAMHGIHRLQVFRDKRIPRKRLRKDLVKVMGRHKNLWLQRNRAGGLEESMSHLQRSLHMIN